MKVVFTIGLPGSGKSTWAKNMAKSPCWKRVNRDELRLMLDFKQFDYKNEKFITKVEKELILSALDSGNSVIIDATNLNKDRVRERKAIIKGYYPDVQFETKNFLNVAIEKCIANDLKRENSVGSKVIYDMWARYNPDPSEYCRLQSSVIGGISVDHKIVLVDVDGTLALMKDRSPFEWSKVIYDAVRVDIVAMVNALKESGHRIIVMSGRDSICREDTITWLDKVAGVQYDELYMRAEGDQRKDVVIKRELFDKHIAGTGCIVALAIDDRPCMVRMYKEMGITTINVDSRVYPTEF